MKSHIAGEVTPDLLALQAEVESWTEEDFDRIFGTAEERAEEDRIDSANRAFLRTAAVEAAYPGRWVAGHDCNVIAHAATWAELARALRSIDRKVVRYAVREMPPR